MASQLVLSDRGTGTSVGCTKGISVAGADDAVASATALSDGSVEAPVSFPPPALKANAAPAARAITPPAMTARIGVLSCFGSLASREIPTTVKISVSGT